MKTKQFIQISCLFLTMSVISCSDSPSEYQQITDNSEIKKLEVDLSDGVINFKEPIIKDEDTKILKNILQAKFATLYKDRKKIVKFKNYINNEKHLNSIKKLHSNFPKLEKIPGYQGYVISFGTIGFKKDEVYKQDEVIRFKLLHGIINNCFRDIYQMKTLEAKHQETQPGVIYSAPTQTMHAVYGFRIPSNIGRFANDTGVFPKKSGNTKLLFQGRNKDLLLKYCNWDEKNLLDIFDDYQLTIEKFGEAEQKNAYCSLLGLKHKVIWIIDLDQKSEPFKTKVKYPPNG